MADSRPFLERFYAEGHLGYLIFSGLSYVGAGYKITSRHYLGLEYVPHLSAGDIGNLWIAVDGLGVQYQYRARKWYFSVSGGVMSEGHYATDGPWDYVPADPPAPFPYFRVATKHCFWGLLCLGCQFGQSGSYKGVAYDASGSVPPSDYEWEESVRSLTISLGVLLQKPPQLK